MAGEEAEQTLNESDSDEDMLAGEAAAAAGSSSSESDSEEEEDGAAELRIQTLEQALRDQPLDYDSHNEYIKCLRKLGEIEKLRKAREGMSKLFPLTPKLWQDWIGDELSLNQSPESFKEIENLYERSVQDYLSVSLWIDYINFVQEHDDSVSQCTPAGVSKMRELFERAITAAGLHLIEGGKIWEAYREFEQALVLTFSENETEEKAKQTQRIRNLFHRQLAVPLADSESTLKDYKIWESEQGNNISNETGSELDGLPPNVVTNYKNATEAFNARKLYEDRIARESDEQEKLQHYMNYIKFEESSGNPARVQILYERAISEFQVSSDLWLAYTNYVDTLKLPSIAKNVYYRATRNCTWVGELWARYLISLERANSSEEEIKTVFEWAVQCTFQTVQEYLELYLTRIDSLRRRFLSQIGTEDLLDFEIIRKTFMDVSDSLAAQLSCEELFNLHEYWAELEINLAKELIQARSVWENLIKKSGSMLEAWKGYISMEINSGNINEARSIYKRCYSKKFIGTGSEDICNAWIRFERKYGTLEDYDFALKKVKPRLNELMIFKAQQESKSKTEFNQPAKTKKNNNINNSPLKRKQTEITSKPPPAKKRKENAPKNKKNETENHQPMEIEIEKETEKGKEKEKEKEKENEKEKEKIKEKEKEEEKETKETKYKDQCTAFISNLHLDTTEEHLRSFFGENGGVTSIRLLRNKFTGGPRGLAYVDFADEKHLQNAIKKNKEFLLEKRLSIAKSDPSRGGRNSNSSPRGRGGRKMPFRTDRNKGRANGGDASPNPNRNRGRSNEDANPNPNPKSNPKNEGTSNETRVTFAAPRALLAKPLGWNKKDGKIEASGEQLKSNDAFRDLFLKK
ncbi:hypothetical protein LUZ60_015908 [Juncus effusus]|nr:hypothetical protein LUZ60_015908 [Juncus effusus]